MKIRKYDYLIPLGFSVLLVLFGFIINLIIDHHTDGQSELISLIYSSSFFLFKPLYFYLVIFLLLTPFVGLIWAFITKRKRLINGLIISSLISIALITVAMVTS